MPSYFAKFSGRTRGAIGINYAIATTVRHADNPEAARLKLYDYYENLHGLELIEVPDTADPVYPGAVTRYVITHVNRDGMRTLSYGANGHHTFETPGEARTRIDQMRANNSESTLRSVFGPVDTFEVCACPCWPGHFDPCGVYFDDDDIVRAEATQ